MKCEHCGYDAGQTNDMAHHCTIFGGYQPAKKAAMTDIQNLKRIAMEGSETEYDLTFWSHRENVLALIQRIEELEKAIKPFAEFNPALLLWRASRGFDVKDKWPEHVPVLRKSYPLNEFQSKYVELYVSDFKAAAIAAQSKKEQG